LQIIRANDGAILSIDAAREQFKLLSVVGLEESRQVISHLPLNKSVEGWIVEHSEPLLIPNINLDERFSIPEHMQQAQYAYLGLPMRSRGLAMGVLIILRSGEPFNLEEITLIGSIADHIALIIDNLSLYHLYEQTAVSEERSRLARDLHDSATQSLYSVTLYAEASRTTVEKGDMERAKQYLERLSQTAQLALQEMRLLVYELRPPSLEQDGLVIAVRKRLESVESRAGIQTHVDMASMVNLTPQQEEHLYWIAMEALNNSIRHASATEVNINLKTENGQVVFLIRDNGKGYDLEKARQSGGMGLNNMQQRAHKIGAQLDIMTTPGAGTTVLIHLPLNPAAEKVS
jgi:signal transduction histidine kinase